MAHSFYFSEIKNHGGNGMATRKIINGIVYEEHGDSLFYPAFADCQQTELTLCGHQAVELMEEIDPSTLDIINISGLGKTIWTEISNSVEQRWIFRQTVLVRHSVAPILCTALTLLLIFFIREPLKTGLKRENG